MASSKRSGGPGQAAYAFEIQLPTGASHAVDPERVADVNYEDLIEEARSHPGKYVFYASALADVKVSIGRVKRRMKREFGTVSKRLRSSAEGAKLTNAVIEAEVELEPKYAALGDELAALEEVEERLGALREALMHRRDILRDLAMLRTPELSGQVDAARGRRYTPKV